MFIKRLFQRGTAPNPVALIFFFALLISSAAFVVIQNPINIGEATQVGDCDADLTVFRISSLERGHAALYDDPNYEVCIEKPDAIFTDRICVGEAPFENSVIRISREANAHVEIPTGNAENYIDICFGDLICDYSESGCAADTECMVTISDFTNAMVGDCETDPYDISICCGIGITECLPGDKRDCPNQEGVCLDAQEICTDQSSWPGCDDTTYGDHSEFYEPGDELSCDELDNDCDGVVDEDATSIFYEDLDGDGYGNDADFMDVCSVENPDEYSDIGGDCNDNNENVNPGAEEICDGLDNQCDGNIDEDLVAPLANLQDGVCSGSLQICDGINGWIEPNYFEYTDDYEVPELSCEDVLDNDCDALTDLNDPDCTCTDGEERLCSNQFGVCSGAIEICAGGEWNGCDDTTYGDYSEFYEPGVELTCDELDNNCDDEIDEGVSNTYYVDNDGDGYGDEFDSEQFCGDAPVGYSEAFGDCDDTDPNIYPGAAEICDAIDNNCDAQIDEGFDQDDCTELCEISGFDWTGNGDVLNCCGDDAGEANPYETNELTCADNNDNDCDGLIDTFDDDCECNPGDERDCALQEGICNGATDYCDDDGIWIGCTEETYYDWDSLYELDEITCDSTDNDCDGDVDEGLKNTLYEDDDGDGFGDEDDTIEVCSEDFSGYVNNDDDCDDSDNDINPDEDEICGDNIDNDCDGDIDGDDIDCPCEDGDIRECGIDAGVCSLGYEICDDEVWGECDGILPSSEICDSLDNDCDGDIDEDFDLDFDGYTTCQASPDCNDNSYTVYPGAAEICGDGVDQSCDGIDNACTVATCFDYIKNQGEEGVDCGGPCSSCGATVTEETFVQGDTSNLNSEELDRIRRESQEEIDTVTEQLDKLNLFLWILIPIVGVLLLAGGLLTFELLKKPPKQVGEPTVAQVAKIIPSDKQLAMDIWTRMYRGENLATIKAKYAHDGIPPEIVRRAVVDFYMAEDAQKKRFEAKRKSKIVEQKKQLIKTSEKLGIKPAKKSDVFDQLRKMK